MKIAKIFIVFTFLLAFAVCVSAQDKTPKIVWKNLQEKYESFYDVKPVLVNEGNQPIYIDCTLEYFEPYQMNYSVEKSDNTKLLMFDEENNLWDWNVRVCADVYGKDREKLKNQYKAIEKLKKAGKYFPMGCKIKPNEGFALNFNEKQWLSLIQGDGIFDSYKSGKFKFKLSYWWYSSLKDQGQEVSESPVFTVFQKETK